MRRVLGILALSLAFGSPAAAQADTVLVARVDGAITPVIAAYLTEGVERAERGGHQAFVVEMDTPGGLDTSMREIVQAFLNAEVPVVVYVSPSGARAASAGAIIGLAADTLAMAPGTNIGAATPVSLGGGDVPEEVGDKVVNDAAAYSVAIAEERDRDTTFAREIVTEGRSEPASEAVDIGAADLVAETRDEVIAEVAPGAEAVTHELGFLRGIRQRLADPNIAFLFMSIGTLALIYELANPGIQFGGIVGVILIVLAFFSLAVLPVNVAGLLLLLLAVGLFAAELFVPGVGVFGAGGAVALALSGVFLFRGSIGVDAWIFVPTALVVGGATVLAGRLVWRARKGPSQTGEGSMVGRTGTLRDADGRKGRLMIDGTWWSAESPDADLAVGQDVRVTEMRGLTLIVEPNEEDEA